MKFLWIRSKEKIRNGIFLPWMADQLECKVSPEDKNKKNVLKCLTEVKSLAVLKAAHG